MIDYMLNPRRTAWDHAWEAILQASLDKPTLDSLKVLFPDRGRLDEHRFSILHKIVLGLDLSDLRQELGNKLSDINIADSHGRTALHWAAKRGDVFVVDLLLKAHADPNLQDGNGDPPLLSSTSLGCAKVLLSAGANVRLESNVKMTMLSQTAICFDADSEYMESLIALGAPVDSRNYLGLTPLHVAARHGRIHMLTTLLKHGVEISALSHDGDSPLAYSSYDIPGTELTAQYLLESGADYTTVNSSGWTILHQFATYSNTSHLKVLRAAELKGVDTEAKNQDGCTALQLAEQRVSKPDAFLELLRTLLSEIRARNEKLRLSTVGSPAVGEPDDSDAADEFIDAEEHLVPTSGPTP